MTNFRLCTLFTTMFVRVGLLLITSVAVGHCSDVMKHIYFDRVHCKVNRYYCPKPICKFTFITRRVKAFTWICDLTKPVDLVDLHVTLYYRFRNGYQKFLIDLNVDVCSYYNNSLGSATMDLVRREMEQYSTNVIHSCPYTGNMTIVNLPMTGALFQYIFLPSGEYKLVITSVFDEKKLFGISLTTFFSIPAGRTLEDDNMG